MKTSFDDPRAVQAALQSRRGPATLPWRPTALAKRLVKATFANPGLARMLIAMRFMLWLRLITTFCGLSAACSSGWAAGPAPGDEFWVVSSRSLTSNVCSADLTNPAFHVSSADACGRLHHRTLQELLGGNEGGATAVYIHGNRFKPYEAIDRGWFAYRNVAQCSPAGRGLRWIVFSWPSERYGVLLKDPREKARRTETHGLYLGWLIQRLAGAENLTLIGYSFGARVATGGLHAAAGGTLSGRQLPGPPVRGLQTGVVLIAPAVDRCWLGPAGYHGLATANIQQLRVFYNSIDPILKRYWLVDEGPGGKAMGYWGLATVAPRLDGIPIQVRQYDCRESVGPMHDEIGYFRPPCNAGSRTAHVLWSPPVEGGIPVEMNREAEAVSD